MTQPDRDVLASVQQTEDIMTHGERRTESQSTVIMTNTINPNPYTANTGAGPSPLAIGVIAWSWGPDQTAGSANEFQCVR